MSRIHNIVAAATLLLSALALSACATKPEAVPVATPAPVEVATEQPVAPEVATEPAPVAAVVAEQPPVSTQVAPKKKVRKAKKMAAKQAPPQAAPPAPVAAPAPIAAPEAPAVVQPEPSTPVTIAPPAKETAEVGFLEQYWKWLLGLVIVIAGIIVWRWNKQPAEH